MVVLIEGTRIKFAARPNPFAANAEFLDEFSADLNSQLSRAVEVATASRLLAESAVSTVATATGICILQEEFGVVLSITAGEDSVQPCLIDAIGSVDATTCLIAFLSAEHSAADGSIVTGVLAAHIGGSKSAASFASTAIDAFHAALPPSPLPYAPVGAYQLTLVGAFADLGADQHSERNVYATLLYLDERKDILVHLVAACVLAENTQVGKDGVPRPKLCNAAMDVRSRRVFAAEFESCGPLATVRHLRPFSSVPGLSPAAFHTACQHSGTSSCTCEAARCYSVVPFTPDVDREEFSSLLLYVNISVLVCCDVHVMHLTTSRSCALRITFYTSRRVHDAGCQTAIS